MNKTTLENGTQIHNNTRSERDKRIFFSLLKNTFGKSDTRAKPETANQEMRESTSIKVEVLEEDVVGKDDSSHKGFESEKVKKKDF